jgi:hypothetical protein
MRWLDQGAAALILLVGLAHVAAASAVFGEPTERRVWFLSAGLFGITAGLVNLARARSGGSVLLRLAALSGSAGLVLMGALLCASGGELGAQAAVVLAIGLLSAGFGLRDLFRPAGRRAR